MKNKTLNVICATAVVIVAAIAIAVKGRSKMNPDNLGFFPSDALDNAPARVNAVIEAARAKADALAAIPEKTYMNFARPLMDSGATIDQVVNPIEHLDNVAHSEETEKIMEEILPTLSAFSSDMSRHKGLYEGYKYVKEHEYDSLDAAQKKLVDDAIRDYQIAGVNLPADKQARLKEIAARLSKLSNEFSNNIIAANKKFKLKITDEKILGEMPDDAKAIAKTDTGWEFSLLDPSYVAFMTYATDRGLRKQMHRARATRAPENEKLIPQILKLRDERAKILGYENVAELIFEDRSAPSPATAKDFLEKLAEAAKPFARRDWAQLRERAAADGVTDLSAWDSAYYSRLVRKEQYNLDEAETKPYFELNATTDGLFGILAEMFDVKLVRREVKLWHPDAKYYDVIRDGKAVAGFYTDLMTRDSKTPGAHEHTYRSRYADAAGKIHLPEAFIVANFPAAKDGVPSLLSPDEAGTLFHETGHALMDLLTQVEERGLSGNNVDWDVVEFPSQFLEAFKNSPAVLKKIARHHKTGEPIPDDLVERIIRADKFQNGMFLVRQIEFGLFDMDIHTRRNLSAADVQKSLDAARAKVSVVPVPPYDKFQNTFSHIFAGGYAAGYYSYLWAQLLAADAYEAFGGNPNNGSLSRKYRDVVLAQGGSKKMDEIYRQFMGRDPDPESILKFYKLK